MVRRSARLRTNAAARLPSRAVRAGCTPVRTNGAVHARRRRALYPRAIGHVACEATSAVSHMKKATTYLRARDLAGSAAGFIAVLGALVLIDGRVTHHVRNLFARDASGEISAVGDRVQALGQAILAAARDQSIDHAPMLVFTAAAIVLVFFMVRT
jgi:hypothetical protein